MKACHSGISTELEMVNCVLVEQSEETRSVIPMNHDCADPEDEPEEPQRTWLTRKLFPDGDEPDPRFTLANERTFLAWIRTGLGLLGGGIALEAFALDVPAVVRTSASAILVLTSLVVSVTAMVRWRKVEMAMRRGLPLPAPTLALVLTVGLTVATVVLLAIFVSIDGAP